jgi:dihydropteroate synthase
MTPPDSRDNPAAFVFQRNPALPRGFFSGGDGPSGRLYLRPLPGGASQPDFCEVMIRYGDRIEVTIAAVSELSDWSWAEGKDVGNHVGAILNYWQRPAASFAGLSLERFLIMGIVNTTPDSFSDGGETKAHCDAIARGFAFKEAGADIVDVGGESTRPGADPVAPEIEAARVIPVIRALAQAGIAVSVDSRHATVMAAAITAGARMVNDVSALSGDPDSAAVVANAGVPVVLMHMQGEPKTMNRNPFYGSVVLDVYDQLAGRVAAAIEAGVAPGSIAVDPGIGFGKTPAHNRAILARLGVYRCLGCPILVGVSRKFGRRNDASKDRLAASLAAGMAAIGEGARILRVHDVAETRKALDVWLSLKR